jgi:hypothetical protein
LTIGCRSSCCDGRPSVTAKVTDSRAPRPVRCTTCTLNSNLAALCSPTTTPPPPPSNSCALHSRPTRAPDAGVRAWSGEGGCAGGCCWRTDIVPRDGCAAQLDASAFEHLMAATARLLALCCRSSMTGGLSLLSPPFHGPARRLLPDPDPDKKPAAGLSILRDWI